jgi:predicted alpha/beta-hydrolase family hydrolase
VTASADELSIDLGDRGSVTALWLRPRGATAVYALAHGAGAGMRHRFMEAIADRLAARKIATFRYQFPYMEAGRKRPDSPKVLEATARAGVEAAARAARGLPLIAGGKSMGGRITSQCQAAEPLPKVRGLAFLGFPLHPPGRPASKRGDHLSAVEVPMLFLQGPRDKLAEMSLMEPLCRQLGKRATLHLVDGADHGFHVLKRSGRTDDEVLDELADAVAAFAERLA